MKAGTKKQIGLALKLFAVLFAYERIVKPGADKAEAAIKSKVGA